MDPSMLSNLILAIVFLSLFLCGMFLALRIVFKNLRFQRGSWGTLADAFPAVRDSLGKILKRQTVQVGAVVYKNCVQLTITPDGLHLSRPSLLPMMRAPESIHLPWAAVQRVGTCKLFWQTAYVLHIGKPEIGAVTLQADVYQQIGRFWAPTIVNNSLSFH